MKPFLRLAVVLCLLCPMAGCEEFDSGRPAATADLRPVLEKYGLTARKQGARDTCSVFTMTGALEFAVARRRGQCPRLSVEFLNWAANQARGHDKDGGYFSEMWKGFSAYGICAEDELPYLPKFDPHLTPPPGAVSDAKTRLVLGLRPHWIKEWNASTGLSEADIAAIKRVLGAGWPVAGGFRWPKEPKWNQDVLQLCGPDAVRDGHSILLVGYRDDAAQPGGGVFIFRNTGQPWPCALMPYAYARDYMNDAVWVE